MPSFSKTISIRWADLDPNYHMRHSVYYDLGAQQRIEIIESLGLTLKLMQEQGFGPILFREECVFKKEILLSDTITLHARLAKCNEDASRWTVQHEFTSSDNKTCATLTLDGAWIDVRRRKLLSPIPQIVIDAFAAFPRTKNFMN
ncbi:MAG: thioesterase family protein [Chitinophagaceae bacterium]|nr:thioesterase family protein [Chitinophagaceae bacterium]